MRLGQNPALLGWVVRGFGQDDSRKGVETGFCQRIAEWALSGSELMHDASEPSACLKVSDALNFTL